MKLLREYGWYRAMKVSSIFNTVILTFSVFSAVSCQEKSPTTAPQSIATPTAVTVEQSKTHEVPPLDKIDISKMPPLGPKRMQSASGDALGNRNQLLEDLIAHGIDTVPFLINQVENTKKMDRHVVQYWYQLSVGDMAFIILMDLFNEKDEVHSTIPGFKWDEFLERGNDKDLTGEEVYRRYIRKYGRRNIKERWQKMWNENKENIFWDDPCRCFRVRNIIK